MKPSSTLTIQIKEHTPTLDKRLLLGLPGGAMLVGLWGTAGQMWSLNTLHFAAVSMIVLVMGLLFSREKRSHRIALLSAVVLLTAGVLLFHRQLSQSLAAWLNAMGQWWLCRTGHYVLPFDDATALWPAACLAAVFAGVATAIVVRSKRMVWQMLICLCVLAALLGGWLEANVFVLVLLAGALALLAKKSSSFPYAIALLAVWSVVVLVLGMYTGTPYDTKWSAAAERKIHHWRYEESDQALPEGKWQELSAYRPNNDKALRVTMDHWTALYLPGFTGSKYTENGWQALSGEEVLQERDRLYALQRDAFCADTQLSAAWQSIGKTAEHTVQVQVLGACQEWNYEPYGIDAPQTDPAALCREGCTNIQNYTAGLYPVEKSYMLQSMLAQSGDKNDYRRAESAYRDWVYAQYLDVPKDVADTLAHYVTAPKDGMSTVQAKQEITKWLKTVLTYDESAGGADHLVRDLLSDTRRGYSVHYATLATLLMRQCGIPARYVEGYLIPQAQAQTLSDGDTLTVTQCNSHAWVEYYLDGVGWLPFDPTPAYSDEIAYELPDGNSVELGSGLTMNEQPDESDQNTLHTQTEKDPKEEQTKRENSGWWILAVAAGLLIVALVVRCIVLRRRLKRYCDMFHHSDRRKATAYMLCYAKRLDDTNLSPDIKALCHEVWYSHHAISAQQQELAQKYLAQTERDWKKHTPLHKRFTQRWIKCCVR